MGPAWRGPGPLRADDRCSIYAHRPRACRTYDCRVFPASGVDPGEGSPVAEPARRWRFRHPGPGDRAEHEAVRAAAAFIDEHHVELFGEVPRPNPSQLAVMAVRVHEAFTGEGPDGVPQRRVPTVAEVVRLVRGRPPRG